MQSYCRIYLDIPRQFKSNTFFFNFNNRWINFSILLNVLPRLAPMENHCWIIVFCFAWELITFHFFLRSRKIIMILLWIAHSLIHQIIIIIIKMIYFLLRFLFSFFSQWIKKIQFATEKQNFTSFFIAQEKVHSCVKESSRN